MIRRAAVEVGPALFFSLLIITLSFLPVFTLEAQEGRLFAPLAFTKTYAMAAAAGLVGDAGSGADGLSRSRSHPAERTTRSTGLIRWYEPVLAMVLRRPGRAMAITALVVVASLWPLTRLGGEFMPPLDEGDLLYMPSALPGVSTGEGGQLAAADRPADQDRARGRTACSARPGVPIPRPIRRRWRCSRRPSASSRASEWRARHDAGQADRRAGSAWCACRG